MSTFLTQKYVDSSTNMLKKTVREVSQKVEITRFFFKQISKNRENCKCW